MKTASLARWLSALGVAVSLISGAASAADVHVMISAGFYRSLFELGPLFERATGHHLVTTRGPSMGNSPEAIPTRLARGEAADVVILDDGAADELAKRGLVRADSKVETRALADRHGGARRQRRSRTSARSTAFRKTLLAAKSIAYSDSGSGTYLSTTLIRKTRRRRSDRGQEPKDARAAIGRAGGRGGGAWRGRDRLPAGQRADPRPRHHFRRPAPGRVQPMIFFAGALDSPSPTARGGQCTDPLSRSPEAAPVIKKAGLAPLSER